MPVTVTVLMAQVLALPAVAAQWPALVLTCRQEIYPFVDTGRASDASLFRVDCAHVTAGEPGVVTLSTWPAAAAAVLMVASAAVALRLLRRR